MVEPRTASQVLAHLAKEGYKEDFRAHKTKISICYKDIELDPASLIVDKIYRFEGESNIGDEEIIFALRCPNTSIKGTYHVAFGPEMDPKDVKIVQKLRRETND